MRRGADGTGADRDLEAFERVRPRLHAVAYGMLGEAGEAEDVVQDAWLRWRDADTREVRSPEGWLVTATTRLAIDRLRSARVRREVHVGPWLPEPISLVDDPAEIVAEAERLSLALLATFERLDPVQRAVLLLRDVLDLDYADVADAVDRTPTACRQIASRARDAAGDPRVRHRADSAEQARLARAFAEAVDGGSVEAITALLAADAVAWSDGGGRVKAARVPISGGPRIARFLSNLRLRLAPPGTTVRPAWVNGAPGLRVDVGDVLLQVSELELDLAVDRVIGLRAIVDPEKLRRVATAGATPPG